MTNVFLIGGGVLAAAGVGLLVFGGDDDSAAGRPASGPRYASPEVRVVPTLGGLSAHGRF